MKINCSKKQRGVIVVAVTIALPILLLIMGLALDFAHVFVNKTRLQNALDATALSAAIVINGDITKNTTTAETKARETFNFFKNATGNAELSDLNEAELVFEYSRTLKPWTTFNPATDKFAFVRVTSTNMLNVTPVLIRVMNQFSNDIAVPAVATAGPVGQNCDLSPIVLCADMKPLPSDEPLDDNCDDNSNGDIEGNKDCYGYEIGKIRNLVYPCKTPKPDGSCNEFDGNLEAGNFNLINLDDMQGGNDIKCLLSLGTLKSCNDQDPGYRNICVGNPTTKPGYTWGNVAAGIDGRFDSDTDNTSYPAYTITGKTCTTNSYSTSDSPYDQYESENNNRVMAVPIVDCRGLQNGQTTLTRVKNNATGCLFLTEKSVTKSCVNGATTQTKAIMAEFTGKSCLQPGLFNSNNAVLNGPYKIVLFKSFGSGDS